MLYSSSMGSVLALSETKPCEGKWEICHMARSDMVFSENMKPMKELHDYKVEPGDPDPRGWNVVGRDGHAVGKVRDLVVDTSAMKVRQLIVDRDTTGAGGRGEHDVMLLDIHDVEVRNDSHQVIATDSSSAQRYSSAADYERSSSRNADYDRNRSSSAGERTLTRAEEELTIGKREVSGGEARVTKHVETERVSTPVTRRREEVVVERRPVRDEMRGDASISDDEVRIPLSEEEVVVEKRPVVKEELVVGKRTVEEQDTVETDVRRERFDIDTNSSAQTRQDRGRREPNS
jgi:uncharacterized protein (TIGR02271 family)